MLLKIVFAKENDEEYKEGMVKIKEAFWPFNIINIVEPDIDKNINDHQIKKRINEREKDYFYELNNEINQKDGIAGEYTLIENDNSKHSLPFPFLSKFYILFSEPNLNQDINYLIKELKNGGNLSKFTKLPTKELKASVFQNAGNYNHFVNVVSATARIIQFFSNEENIRNYLCKDDNQGEWWELAEILKYKLERPTGPTSNNSDHLLRIMNLMFAAFYHDIGKSLVNERHGMEGANIISFLTTESVFQLQTIVNKSFNANFEHEDLFFIADLILYHDLFGTFSTGEGGYIKLVDLIHRITAYCSKYSFGQQDIFRLNKNAEKEKRLKWNKRHLFDLWVLNLADILASIKNKFEEQDEWYCYESAENKIKIFFDNQENKKGFCLLHDLRLSLKLLDFQTEHEHSDSLTNLHSNALKLSERHVIERFRRLISEIINNSLNPDYESFFRRFRTTLSNEHKKIREIDDELYKEIKRFYAGLKTYLDKKGNQVSTILRSIRAFGNYNETITRFAYIGSMDYSLGFFQKIAERILFKVILELIADHLKIPLEKATTHWISIAQPSKQIRTIQYEGYNIDKGSYEDYYSKAQAKMFLDNFTATLVQIVNHVLFREASIDTMRNLEFKEANDRLTKEKIDIITSLEGPSRSRRTIDLIIQTIFYW